MASYELLPSQSLLPHPLPATLTLSARPESDIWAVPPDKIHFSAPFTCTTLPCSSFRRIRATISANFTQNTQQGGLLIILPPRSNQQGSPSASSGRRLSRTRSEVGGRLGTRQGRRWVTATLEYEHGRMNVSVVSCERWADWSLHPLPQEGTSDPNTYNQVTLEMERKLDTNGAAGSRLKVSILGQEEARIIREVTWAFEEDEGDIWVGVLANMAAKDRGGEELGEEVRFEALSIDTV